MPKEPKYGMVVKNMETAMAVWRIEIVTYAIEALQFSIIGT